MGGGGGGGVCVPCLVPLQVVCSVHQGKFVIVVTVLFCFSAVFISNYGESHMIWLGIFTSSFFFFY